MNVWFSELFVFFTSIKIAKILDIENPTSIHNIIDKINQVISKTILYDKGRDRIIILLKQYAFAKYNVIRNLFNNHKLILYF